MNHAIVAARLADLRAGMAKYEEELRALQQRAAVIQANLHATSGAAQDCEYWLSQMPEDTHAASTPALRAVPAGE